MALAVLNFESYYLHSNHEISIILPDMPRTEDPKCFYGSQKKYPVLWLLHGTFGDHSDWLRKSKIELYACERNVIVVMPSALNSFYSNWDGFCIGYSMWDYLTEELMPLVYNWFPASDKRKDNYIAGLSMGGFGAIKYASMYPQKFAGVAILSATAFNPEFIDLECADVRTINNINNAGGYDQYIHSYENTWEDLKKFSGKGESPQIYCACGTEDNLMYDQFLKFRDYAEQLKLDICFEEGKGKHEWRFWDTYIERAMNYFGLDILDAVNSF